MALESQSIISKMKPVPGCQKTVTVVTVNWSK